MNTDQITAEARMEITKVVAVNGVLAAQGRMAAIIQSAIEKAHERGYKLGLEIGHKAGYEQGFTKAEESRATHASEQEDMEYICPEQFQPEIHTDAILDNPGGGVHASEPTPSGGGEKWKQICEEFIHVCRALQNSGYVLRESTLDALQQSKTLQPRDCEEDTKRLDILEELWSEKSLAALDYGKLKYDTLRQTIDGFAAMKSQTKEKPT